jgi:hypothetical protein
MTIGKSVALGAAIVGAMAVGVAIGPSLTDRFAARTSQPAITESQPAAKQPAQARPGATRGAPGSAHDQAASKAKAEAAPGNAAAKLPASEPQLQARLKPVLNRGVNMAIAAEGFRDAEQFATVAHAARNTHVPFMLLKHRILNEKKTLADALKASKPDIDAASEVARARSEAKSDLAAVMDKEAQPAG